MAKISRKELRQIERKVLDSLVDYYYESGYTQDAYRDPETGGIYEHKLAVRIGYKLIDGRPPHEFIAAALILEANGHVRRIVRKPDFPVMGIWPTPKGLDRHEYLHQSPIGKLGHHLAATWPTITVSFATTVITLMLSAAVKNYIGG